jgi:hypothetical protein
MLNKTTIFTLAIGLIPLSLGAFLILKEDRLTSEVRNFLKDPESANFRNTETFQGGVIGEVLCGEFNAVNGFGVYIGWKGFVYDKTGLKIEGEDPSYELTAAMQCSTMTNIYTIKAMTLINIGKQIIGAQQLHVIDNNGSRAVELSELLTGGYMISEPVDIDVVEGEWKIENEGLETVAKIDQNHSEICNQFDEHPALNFPEDRSEYQYGCRETEVGTIFFMSQ